MDGDRSLRRIEIRNNRSGETEALDCAALFLFIGARPHTDWLPPGVLLDEKCFVVTSSSFGDHPFWQLGRRPCELETTVPGIMAAGDVRTGTTKRCGFAVGDGSLAVACVHRYLSGLT